MTFKFINLHSFHNLLYQFHNFFQIKIIQIGQLTTLSYLICFKTKDCCNIKFKKIKILLLPLVRLQKKGLNMVYNLLYRFYLIFLMCKYILHCMYLVYIFTLEVVGQMRGWRKKNLLVNLDKIWVCIQKELKLFDNILHVGLWFLTCVWSPNHCMACFLISGLIVALSVKSC